MIRKPKAFLLDEPLSNLDAALREKMRGELIALHNSLKTLFFYVTHDQTEAMAMGDRIIVLNKGEVQQIDTPSKIYNHPANLFVAGFIGNPRMNFIEPTTYEKIGGCKIIDSSIVVGIRPENIVIRASDSNNPACGKVLYSERFGRETHYHVSYDNQVIVVCVPSVNEDASMSNGDYVVCVAEESRFLFFDKECGNSIELTT